MESSMETAYNAIVSILLASPTIIVAFVGIILAMIRWRRHPKVSLLALVGFAIYLMTSILFPLVYAILPTLLINRTWSTESFSIFYRVTSLMHYFIEAVALALLLAAVMAGRGKPAQPDERNLA